MAELEILPRGDGASSSPPAGGKPKKKMKLNKKSIVIVGGLGIVAFLLISSLFKKSAGSQEAGGTMVVGDGMPTNSADVQAQLQSFQDILGSQVQSELNNYGSQIEANNNAILSEFTGILGTTTQGYQDKLDAYQEKFSGLEQANNDLKLSFTDQLAKQKLDADAALKKAQDDAKKQLDAFKKSDAAADKAKFDKAQAEIKKAQAAAAKAKADAQKALALTNKKQPAKKPVAKPPVKKPVTKPPVKKPTNTKGLNVGTSIVDNLKAQGKDSSFAARKKLAAASGIKNYTGTAKQNVALLNKQKAAAKKKK